MGSMHMCKSACLQSPPDHLLCHLDLHDPADCFDVDEKHQARDPKISKVDIPAADITLQITFQQWLPCHIQGDDRTAQGLKGSWVA